MGSAEQEPIRRPGPHRWVWYALGGGLPAHNRGMSALGGVLLGLIFSLAYVNETTENRVVRAGYPAGTASAHREQAALLREQRESERRRAAAAKRAARYRAGIGG